ncbi:MAG TPA: hypothetical protein PL001_00105 [Candidatus Kryptobacter bacterium]|nr:hypothetical protein [Candidatus Kryptobacter bacterium]
MKFEIVESSELVGKHGAVSKMETDIIVEDMENKTLILTQKNGLVKWIMKYERIEQDNFTGPDMMIVHLAPGERVKEIMHNAIADVIAAIVMQASKPQVPLNLHGGKPFPRS